MMKRFLIMLACLVLLFALCPDLHADAADEPSVKIAAFTFDDGPTRTITPKLLDALAERDVHVTFFVNGANAEHNPDIVLRAAAARKREFYERRNAGRMRSRPSASWKRRWRRASAAS